jgi:hypothetical protein
MGLVSGNQRPPRTIFSTTHRYIFGKIIEINYLTIGA